MHIDLAIVIGRGEYLRRYVTITHFSAAIICAAAAAAAGAAARAAIQTVMVVVIVVIVVVIARRRRCRRGGNVDAISATAAGVVVRRQRGHGLQLLGAVQPVGVRAVGAVRRSSAERRIEDLRSVRNANGGGSCGGCHGCRGNGRRAAAATVRMVAVRQMIRRRGTAGGIVMMTASGERTHRGAVGHIGGNGVGFGGAVGNGVSLEKYSSWLFSVEYGGHSRVE